VADLQGGDAADNAAIVNAVLGGQPGPHRDVVLLNAAAGLVAAGVSPDLEAGLTAAAVSIDTGAAAQALRDLVEVSQRLAV
jgi:anthranilate phosphoribosyltransferase